MKKYRLQEICQIIGVEDNIITEFVHKEWIVPEVMDQGFDDEDLTRVRLILDLMNNLSVNEEAVPIILHLIDQIHNLHHELHQRSQKNP